MREMRRTPRNWKLVLAALLAVATAFCSGGDPALAAESITAPDQAGNVGYHTALALDSSGNPVISYWDYTNGDLKVMHCNDRNCAGGGESINAADTAGDVGRFTSLALDSAGLPVISYYRFDTGNLKVMHCNDPSCAGGGEME